MDFARPGKGKGPESRKRFLTAGLQGLFLGLFLFGVIWYAGRFKDEPPGSASAPAAGPGVPESSAALLVQAGSSAGSGSRRSGAARNARKSGRRPRRVGMPEGTASLEDLPPEGDAPKTGLRPGPRPRRPGSATRGGAGAPGGSGAGTASGTVGAGRRPPGLSHSSRIPANAGAGDAAGAGEWEAPELDPIEAPKAAPLKNVKLALTPFADGNVDAEIEEVEARGAPGSSGAPSAPAAGPAGGPAGSGGDSGNDPAGMMASLDMDSPEFADKTEREVWCEFQSREERIDKLKRMVRSNWGPNCPYWKPYMTNCPGDPNLLTEDLVCGKWKHADPGKGCCNTPAHCVQPNGFMSGAHGMWQRRVPCYIRKYQREHELDEVGAGTLPYPSIRIVSYDCGGLPEGTIWTYRMSGYTFWTDVQGAKADSRGNYVHISGPKGKKSYMQIFDPDCGQISGI